VHERPSRVSLHWRLATVDFWWAIGSPGRHWRLAVPCCLIVGWQSDESPDKRSTKWGETDQSTPWPLGYFAVASVAFAHPPLGSSVTLYSFREALGT
jgi:hypothetical protein